MQTKHVPKNSDMVAYMQKVRDISDYYDKVKVPWYGSTSLLVLEGQRVAKPKGTGHD